MNEFFSYSRAIVENFLQTAVFLDDEPTYRYAERMVEPAIVPARRGIQNKVSEISKQTTKDKEHFLDATSIIDTFMEKGIVCSILNCEINTYQDKVDQYIKLMKKADIIILDWSLFKDSGERISELIKQLIAVDEALHELRSIVIYTANPIESIKKQLLELNIKFYDNSNISYNKKYTSVSIYAKPYSSNSAPELKVDFSSLVNKCIDDFTFCFNGIIPNIAMASVAEIRNNTHKLLGVLNKDLDIAYLSHRALLSVSEDAEKHIEEIVTSEIESIIHCNQVGKNATFNIIRKSPVLENKKYQNIVFDSCLKEGVEKKLLPNQKKQFDKDVKKCFTERWYLDEAYSKSSEKDFAVLSLLQTNYSSKNIYLTLGVIIEEKKSAKKFLCLQPRCDSTRLENETEFIFLELQNERENKFDIILPSNEKYILVYGRKYRKTITFKPKNGAILSTEALYFNSINKTKYKYIATLKKAQAQRISNEYGAYLSRVGLNESEYLRRSRSSPKD